MILEVFLINYFFCVIFQRFFAIFSVSFQYFLKWVSALKFPLNAKESYANNIVLSVESIKLMTIIKRKWDKTEEGHFIICVIGTSSHQIIIYIDLVENNLFTNKIFKIIWRIFVSWVGRDVAYSTA